MGSHQSPRAQFFRAGVGIAVLDSHGRVLAFERRGHPGSWQLPQGGLEVGEEPIDAARRELAEETGLDWKQIDVLGEHPEWLAYELDAEKRRSDIGRGQVQKWYFVRLIDAGARVDFTAIDERKGASEFTAFEWMSFDDLIDRTAPFRIGIYRVLADYARALRATGQ